MYSFTLCLVNWGRNHKSLVRKDMLQIKPRLSPFLPLNCAMWSFSVYFSALALHLNFKWKHLLIRFRSQGHVTEMGSVLAYFKMCSTFFNSIISEGVQAFFFVVCSQILSDNFRFRQNMLAHLSSTLPKIVRFFFLNSWWKLLCDERFDFEASTWIGLFLFCFSFFNQPS